MTLFECYNERKGALAAQLHKAASLSETSAILSGFLDMLQYSYAESCKLDALRSASAFMVSAVKTSFPLLECVSDVKLWESDGEKGALKPARNRRRLFGILSLIFGIVAVGISSFAYLAAVEYAKLDEYQICLYAILAGCALLVASGLLLARRPTTIKKEQKVTVLAKADDITRRLTAVVLQMDKNLAIIEADEINRKKAEREEFTPEQLELFSQLLEGKYSGSDELARESLVELEHYLHNRGVELVSYKEGNERLFDLLPSEQADETLRPALLRDGRTLKKGLATQGTEVNER